ncbi:MAG: hypothetical protein RBR68_11845 [Tenuifilaceae bacterium]|nr:hypothetical protein [Tenuifilaceae bacterium]
MIKDNERYIEKEFLSSDKIVDKTYKNKMLNLIDSKITEAMESTTEISILDALESLRLIVKDAYIITMYDFQFKILLLSLQKEIANIRDTIIYAANS